MTAEDHPDVRASDSEREPRRCGRGRPTLRRGARRRTVFGDVDLLVPEGVIVEVRTRTVFGDVRQQASQTPVPGAPRVILTGGTIFGDVRVRTERLRERLADRLLGRGPRG